MRKPVKISVTWDDIKKAINSKGDQFNCPVVRAIKRKYHKRDVQVYDSSSIAINGFNYEDLSSKVTKFVDNFDDGQKVYPFTFEMERAKWSVF